MATFVRLLQEKDKAAALESILEAVRSGQNEPRAFDVRPSEFFKLPKAPFAYWAGASVRDSFRQLNPFETEERTCRQGLATAEDFRFVRIWWEPSCDKINVHWFGFAKGGAYSPFYSDVTLLVDWANGGEEIKAGICGRYPYLNGNPDYVAKNTDFYFRPGLTWPRRTSSGLSMRAMPSDCVFADKGPAVFFDFDDHSGLLELLSLSTSLPFNYLVGLQLAAADAAARSYEVGVIQRTPVPTIPAKTGDKLAALARRACSLKRKLDTVNETSHAFILPSVFRSILSDYNPPKIQAELSRVQEEIDDICFDLYGFDEADRQSILGDSSTSLSNGEKGIDDQDDEDGVDETIVKNQFSLLSWCMGVSFGRFDWRLATGEREVSPEPEPFHPLPAKSTGMLPDGDEPFHLHGGILVDDHGHPHDVVRLFECVLDRVDLTGPSDMRRWLQRSFFKEHLSQYSMSRRKAPIYWPLSTPSGNYTLWIYYPALTNQTLYTTVNDFLEPKLKEVADNTQALRSKSVRSAKEEKESAQLQDLEIELKEMCETILTIAKDYIPNHDDGVQITAAPLWSLFQHKPWQKVLKNTWIRLQKGDYDWAHLAMNYWPDRVREKCKTDKSLAIAHGLEELYSET